MAIDTRNKRQSALQMIAIMVMNVPSGTIGTSARQTATWLYNGITPLAPVPGALYVSNNPYWSRSSS